jgi:hypothetical protein
MERDHVIDRNFGSQADTTDATASCFHLFGSKHQP